MLRTGIELKHTMSATELRIVLLILGIIVLSVIYWFGRPGRGVRSEPRPDLARREPVLAADGGEPHFSALADEPWHRDPVAGDLPELRIDGLSEKAGLVHGDLGIFHRLVDSKPELGPIFSMANMVRPGVFDLSQMDQFSTPGVVLFLTLPGPLSALDAWDTMLPAAQRFSDLLGAQLLDDQRTPLGRQRIAALRDELRAIDRKREQLQIRPGW